MKKTTCFCDRCGNEITDGTVYKLTCYAEGVNGGLTTSAAAQNVNQNMKLMNVEQKELCQECKDALTDGLFIV